MRLARIAAERITLPRSARQFPSFSEVEDQCADEYEDLLGLLHDDDVFEAADLERQETLVQAIQIALPEAVRQLIDELVDNQAAQVWLQQEGAFHLGMAIGLRLGQAGHRVPEPGQGASLEDEEDRQLGRRSRYDYYDEDEDDEEDDDEEPGTHH
jgi:hypothetical protein